MVNILEIEADSIAQDLGILPGAVLLKINNKDIRDNLDYRFHAAADVLELLIEQNGELILFDVEKESHEEIGLVLEDLTMRKCGNKCVFCFVHQNPKKMRRAIYFKDEDYRFSFLYGHYVTLTNANQDDLDRIVEQRLTPLYVSVHVTEPELRKYMLGIKFDDKLLEKIEFLSSRGIELNCQIVLCPDLNDGVYLEKTISDLKQFYPAIKSIAIVPVGLTRHRRNLPALKPVTEEYARKLFVLMDEKRKQLKKELGSSFVYLSDEFYIKTDSPIPPNNYYEGFYQLENGVGLTRDFMNRFRKELPALKRRNPSGRFTFVSGVLGAKVLNRYFIPELNTLPDMQITLQQVVNRFFGDTIVVSGLLVGQDISHALKDKELGDFVVLPPRVLNHDGIFLDDWTVEELELKLNRKVIIFPDSFVELFRIVERERDVQKSSDSQSNRHSSAGKYVVEHMKGGAE